MRSDISIEEALEIVLSQGMKTEAIQVPLLDALSSVLADDIYADCDMPPFDKSPLDGYAVMASDIKNASKEKPVKLDVIDFIPAGYVSNKEIKSGQAMKIMTGAQIPNGADVVIRFEDTVFTDTGVTIFQLLKSGSNISRKGEDMTSGDLVLNQGSIINAPEVGILATLGRSYVNVYRQPRIAIISTGDELLDPHQPLMPGKIRNSNAYTLAALIKKIGAKPLIMGICNDDIDSIVNKITPTLEWADIIITTGGVSVGDCDLVKEAFVSLGAEVLFWRVKMKPGTPIAVAKYNKKLLFGLSGNPAAAYITFEQFVRPVILRTMGRNKFNLMKVSSILVSDFKKVSNQNRFVRAHTYYENNCYYTVLPDKHSSGVLSSLSGTNSLFFVESGMGPYVKGQEIVVQLLDHPEVY